MRNEETLSTFLIRLAEEQKKHLNKPFYREHFGDDFCDEQIKDYDEFIQDVRQDAEKLDS